MPRIPSNYSCREETKLTAAERRGLRSVGDRDNPAPEDQLSIAVSGRPYGELQTGPTKEDIVANTQRIAENSSGNQQIHTHGDVTAPFAKDGGISFGGDNHGIVITSVPTPEGPQHTFDITTKTRIPTPAAFIGVVSSLITIAGFVTGGFSIKQLIDAYRSSGAFNGSGASTAEYWWLFGSVLAIIVSFIGLSFAMFLRRNVLRLPKLWFFRAWAGIKEASGRTYPYSLRLSMRCPKCKNQKLRFQQVPEKWVDFYDGNGKHTKRDVTKWASMAVCPRNEEHSIRVDISGNDFDEALPR